MSTRNENKSRSRRNSACSTCALHASNWSSVRYHCCNCRAATRTRGVRLALRSASSRQAAMKRRPRRSQTKSLSSHRARACSLPGAVSRRSEEHTSELQSQSNLVCRLLLEKKKKHYKHLLFTILQTA